MAPSVFYTSGTGAATLYEGTLAGHALPLATAQGPARGNNLCSGPTPQPRPLPQPGGEQVRFVQRTQLPIQPSAVGLTRRATGPQRIGVGPQLLQQRIQIERFLEVVRCSGTVGLTAILPTP